MSTIGISLGWDCQPAIIGLKKGLRPSKEDGYKTCPFDMMLSNYPGLIECLKDDFKYLADPEYLELIRGPTEWTIFHKKYRFAFNHESPGHADLYIKEEWPEGRYHFILNNYAHFKERYNNRIKNFKSYMRSGKHIQFILNRINTNSLDELNGLDWILQRKYPKLSYEFILISPHSAEYVYKHFKEMRFEDNEPEMRNINYIKQRKKVVQTGPPIPKPLPETNHAHFTVNKIIDSIPENAPEITGMEVSTPLETNISKPWKYSSIDKDKKMPVDFIPPAQVG